ncbi:MAG: dolichyl-phosphate beta-glucosyltransferase [Patescibacteria group bacterium]
MKNKLYLSVVIPAYNEEINLKRGVLDSVYEYLKDKEFTWEVIISNDASKDNTSHIVKKYTQKYPNFRLIDQPVNLGKGGNVLSGMSNANGQYVLFTDMDQSTPIDQFDKFLPYFSKGVDIVIGSRAGRPGQSFVRKMMAYGFATLRNLILRLPYKDTQCGFKAFKSEAIKAIIPKMQIFGKKSKSGNGSVTAGFDLETLYVARKLKLKVAEVPVEWYEYGERKEVNPIKDSYEGLRDLIKVRLNAIQGKYK